MAFRKLFLYVVLLLGIGSYIWWVEIPTSESRLKQDAIFSGLSREQIQTIEIHGSAGSFILVNAKPNSKSATVDPAPQVELDVEMENPEGLPAPGPELSSNFVNNWQFSDLKDAKLDAQSLGSLLTAILNLQIGKPLPPEEVEKDLSVYGLKDPELKISLKYAPPGESISTRDVSFGDKIEYLNQRYLMISGNTSIFMVPEQLFVAANRSRSDFRDKSPIGFADQEVQTVQFSAQESNAKLERSPEGTWRLTSPQNWQASETAVSDFLWKLRSLKVAEFIEGDQKRKSDLGLDKPKFSATIEFRPELKRKPMEIALTSSLEGTDHEGKQRINVYLYVSDTPSYYRLESEPLADLTKPVNSFREKFYFQFATDLVTGADLIAGESKAHIERKDGEWRVNEKEGDTVFIRQLFSDLSELEAVDWPVTGADFGFSNPRLKVSLTLEGQAAPKVLVVGNQLSGSDENPRYFAAVDKLTETFIISEKALKKIVPREEVLVKSKKVEGADSSAEPTLVAPSTATFDKP